MWCCPCLTPSPRWGVGSNFFFFASLGVPSLPPQLSPSSTTDGSQSPVAGGLPAGGAAGAAGDGGSHSNSATPPASDSECLWSHLQHMRVLVAEVKGRGGRGAASDAQGACEDVVVVMAFRCCYLVMAYPSSVEPALSRVTCWTRAPGWTLAKEWFSL